MEHLIRVLTLLAAIPWVISASRPNLRETETELLRLLLNSERYDKRVRPPAHNETGYFGKDDYVLVRVNTLVRSFGPIDDHNKDYTVSLTMRQFWNDRRLQFSPQDNLKYITLTSVEDIWSPDMFFTNEKEGRIYELLKPNTLVRISHNGDVLYSSRVTMKLSCPMNTTNFPLDNQICHIRMASYAYPTNALRFLWQEEEPVQFSSKLHTKPFEIQGYMVDSFNSKTVTGEYSCIRLHFYLTRMSYGYILHFFLPLGLLVIASWAPLWLDFHGEEKFPAVGIVGRCLMSLLCLIVAITEAARVTTSAPPCSGYSCAIDIWTTWCQIFIALVLMEVITVTVIDHWRDNRLYNNGATKSGCFSMSHGGVETGDSKFKPKRNYFKRWLMKWQTAGQKVDILCRILFPLAFVIFNIAFWSANVKSLDTNMLSTMNRLPA